MAQQTTSTNEKEQVSVKVEMRTQTFSRPDPNPSFVLCWWYKQASDSHISACLGLTDVFIVLLFYMLIL